jgi:DNA repair protein RadD
VTEGNRPSAVALRPYQHNVIADLRRQLLAGVTRVMLVAPTGSGKTVIFAAVIKEVADEGLNVLVLAHRREIVGQTRNKLHDNEIQHGVIRAGTSGRPLERVQAGDYIVSQLADRMDRAELIGDIVTHWHKYGERRKTVCFAVNVAHSIHIRDEFIKSGVRAEHIDGQTPKDERDSTLARLASGEIELVTNCMVLTEGFDCPDMGTIILARPTRSMGLYRQMVGRGLRPAPGKPDVIILDHSGAVYRHGFVEDHVEWTLDPDLRAESKAHKRRSDSETSRLLECTNCGALREGGKPCSHCGFMPARSGRAIELGDGELELVNGDRNTNRDDDNPIVRAQWHAMLTAIAAERNYKPGWISHKYKEKFGRFPSWGVTVQPEEPTPEVRSWVRSRQIAYAKRRQ